MRWEVLAADARSGEERRLHVEASSAEEAEAKARNAGYLVSSAAPAAAAAPGATAVPPADALAQLAAAAGQRADAAPARPPPVPYRAPPGAHLVASEALAVPDYLGLRFAAFALSVFAGLAYIAGALMVLLAIIALLTGTGSTTSVRSRAPAPGLAAALIPLLMSLWPLAAGAMLHGFSAACLALRDIARNSFNR